MNQHDVTLPRSPEASGLAGRQSKTLIKFHPALAGGKSFLFFAAKNKKIWKERRTRALANWRSNRVS